MRRSPVRSRMSAKPFVLEEHLNWYALAATAAGLGMLGSSQLSQAEIVYTKAHRPVAPNTTFHLDLNHDGIADFSLKDTLSSKSLIVYGRLFGLPIGPKNQIAGHQGFFGRVYASALFAGVRVGPKAQFLSYQGLMAESTFNGQMRAPAQGYCTGPWVNVTDRYLGLKFEIKGEVHFGWARFNVSCLNQNTEVVGLLTGYAYETVPNRPIVMGRQRGSEEVGAADQQGAKPRSRTTVRPASLGRLAQGTAGLAAWRRKE
jgi:hypothetical protein